jgi:hypothetical protein
VARYAQDTAVPADRSRAEIERTLQRYGAHAFGYGWTGNRALITFAMNDRRVRLDVEMPDRDADEFRLTPGRRYKRDPDSQRREWEKATRQRWRALALVVKAKLEAVEAGISTFESEFLAHIMLPDGSTVGETMAPQVEEAYASGQMPPGLMLALPEGKR